MEYDPKRHQSVTRMRVTQPQTLRTHRRHGLQATTIEILAAINNDPSVPLKRRNVRRPLTVGLMMDDTLAYQMPSK